MQSSNPLLSVVIPTKKSRVDNRLVHAIASVLALPGNDLELIVHLDGDCEKAEIDLSAEFSDPRMKLFVHHAPLTMSENWTAAMERVTGEYVILIGDDDAVRPELFAVAQWARTQTLDCVLQSNCMVYYWPTYPDEKRAGQLRSMRYSGSTKNLDMKGIALYNSFGPKTRHYELMPEVYHGLMRTAVLREMAAVTGHCFSSAIPDLYFAFAVPPFIKKAVIIDFPFSLSGYSGKANSGKFKAQKVAIEQKNVHAGGEWPVTVPRTTDFVSYYAKSKFDAYRDSGQDHLIANINCALSFAHTFVNRPWSKQRWTSLWNQYREAQRELKQPLFVGIFKLAAALKWVLIQRVSLLLPVAFHLVDRKNNAIFKKKPALDVTCEDISGALLELKRYLDKENLSVENVLGKCSAC